MSTWNTEPPNDTRDVLIKDKNDDYLVAYWIRKDNVWLPNNVRQDQGFYSIKHDLDTDTIVWQELQK